MYTSLKSRKSAACRQVNQIYSKNNFLIFSYQRNLFFTALQNFLERSTGLEIQPRMSISNYRKVQEHVTGQGFVIPWTNMLRKSSIRNLLIKTSLNNFHFITSLASRFDFVNCYERRCNSVTVRVYPAHSVLK